MEMSEFPSAYAVREGPQLKIPAARLVKAEYPAEDDVKDSTKAVAKIDAKAHIANLPVASAVKEASDLGRTNVGNEAEYAKKPFLHGKCNFIKKQINGTVMRSENSHRLPISLNIFKLSGKLSL